MNTVTEIREDGITPVTRLVCVEEKTTSETKTYEKGDLEQQRATIVADVEFYISARQKEIDFIDGLLAEFGRATGGEVEAKL